MFGLEVRWGRLTWLSGKVLESDVKANSSTRKQFVPVNIERVGPCIPSQPLLRQKCHELEFANVPQCYIKAVRSKTPNLAWAIPPTPAIKARARSPVALRESTEGTTLLVSKSLTRDRISQSSYSRYRHYSLDSNIKTLMSLYWCLQISWCPVCGGCRIIRIIYSFGSSIQTGLAQAKVKISSDRIRAYSLISYIEYSLPESYIRFTLYSSFGI